MCRSFRCRRQLFLRRLTRGEAVPGLAIFRLGPCPGLSGMRLASPGKRRPTGHAPAHQVKVQPPQLPGPSPPFALAPFGLEWPQPRVRPAPTGCGSGELPLQLAARSRSTASTDRLDRRRTRGSWDHRTMASQPRCSCVLPCICKSRLAAEVSVGSASCADLCVRGRPVGVGNVAGCGHARPQSRLGAITARGNGWPRQRPTSAAGSVSSTSQWIRRPAGRCGASRTRRSGGQSIRGVGSPAASRYGRGLERRRSGRHRYGEAASGRVSVREVDRWRRTERRA